MPSNEQVAYRFLVGKGMTPQQAAGIVGNLMQESGVNPESQQSGGPGRGIAQWSVGQRWRPELMTGNVAQDLMAQLNYLWSELQGSEHASLVALQQAFTPTQAADIFEQYYERAGVPNNGAREANANSIFAQAQSGNWSPMSAAQMGSSGSFNTGGTITSTPGNNLNGVPLSNADLPTVVQWIKLNWGAFAWLLNVPEVTQVIEQAAITGLSPDQVQAKIQSTNWWRTTSAALRQSEQDRFMNPADWNFNAAGSKAAQMLAQIFNTSATLGVQLTPGEAQQIALQALQFNWSTQQIQAAVGKDVRGGNALQVAQQINAMANQYYQTMSPGAETQWAQQIVGGTRTMQEFQAQMAHQAAMKWTGYAQQLQSGYTMQQLTDNLRTEAAKTMEVDPNAIDFRTNPTYQKIIDFAPPVPAGASQLPQHRVMTLSEMDQYLKGTHQWDFTQQARDQAGNLEQTITQDLGKLPGATI